MSQPKDRTATSPSPAPAEDAGAAHPGQFALLRQRRFAPFFWTQFAGAANDNLFKFAFTVMVTYQLQVAWMPPAMAGLAIGALFVLPFLLFSATAGQLADKYDKTALIRLVKTVEIGIMLLAGAGFAAGSAALLLACVFLMGLHSTVFGPVKFAYLPQVLREHELTGGNGMVEMGTFVAILLGNVAGGLLVAVGQGAPDAPPAAAWLGMHPGHLLVAAACLGLALLGRLAAQGIPPLAATDPALRIRWNPATETWRNLRLANGDRTVFRSLLGISWMWFFGAVFLSQFPSFAREVLHGDERVASLLLVAFSVGIGTGALLCEVLGRRQVEIGLVPLGAIGMSVFAIDLYFASRALPPVADAAGAPALLGLAAFLGRAAHWRVLADLLLLSLFAGLYSVPMYALVQMRSQPTHRARIIAANNILNALFMIASALIAGALLAAGATVPQVFLLTGLANALVAGYIFWLVPEYLLRFLAWGATRLVYRFRVRGAGHIPRAGPALLVCNHVSFVDPVLLMAASPRPIHFVMDHRIFATPGLGAVFRLARAIPVAPRSEDPAVYRAAFDRAAQVLRDGELLAIFPEGGLTPDGRLQDFKGGAMKILERAREDGLEVPVVPMALSGLWGSFFSRIERRGGRPTAMARPFRRGLFSRVGLRVGAPVPAASAGPALLRERVAALLQRP
jgi:1-acyl-sn-glycerol-3-phosphate acyltransferase